MITRDDFEAWRAHPVTEEVTALLRTTAQAAVDQFKASAWEGVFDPVTHARVVGRVDAYLGLADLTYEQFAGESD